MQKYTKSKTIQKKPLFLEFLFVEYHSVSKKLSYTDHRKEMVRIINIEHIPFHSGLVSIPTQIELLGSAESAWLPHVWFW